MGTNYYWNENPCEKCGRGDEFHIGKSSAGWYFMLRIHPENSVDGLEDWKRLWPTGTILDEYGKTVTSEEMLKIICERTGPPGRLVSNQWLKDNHAERGVGNLVRCKDSIYTGCTYDLVDWEFC